MTIPYLTYEETVTVLGALSLHHADLLECWQQGHARPDWSPSPYFASEIQRVNDARTKLRAHRDCNQHVLRQSSKKPINSAT